LTENKSSAVDNIIKAAKPSGIAAFCFLRQQMLPLQYQHVGWLWGFIAGDIRA